MKIAILDAVPKIYWKDDEGRGDGEKIAEMLKQVEITAELDVFTIAEGQWPSLPSDHQTGYAGYILSGSPCSANETYTWTAQLSALIDQALTAHCKLVGICFGHQFIARHLGGQVIANPGGWRIGLHRTHLTAQRSWMQAMQTENDIYYFNQDQVAQLPPGAESLGGDPNCRHSAWALRDDIFCLQGHPEQPLRSMLNFTHAMRNLIDREVLDEARRSMQGAATDAMLWAQWIRNFLLASH